MSVFPKVGPAFSAERLGVNAVAQFAAANGLIWRENSIKDVGIDGQLEYVNGSGLATGRIVALQIKSGPSFFTHDDGESWLFYPEEKHRIYWERFPVPVILVLHKPDTEQTFWLDVRQAYRSGAQDNNVGASVPKSQEFKITSRTTLFDNAGLMGEEFTESLDQVLTLLVTSRSKEASFPLSFFQLFVNGLTNIVRSIYFGMDLVTNLVESNLIRTESEYSMGTGSDEYDFLFRYVEFLVSQDLANVDFGDCLIDWNDMKLVPCFVAPLSSRGRALVRLISEKEDQLRSAGVLAGSDSVRIAQEHLFQMVFTEREMERMPLIDKFERSIINQS
jgi:Domain of unknown function (DUF4365)